MGMTLARKGKRTRGIQERERERVYVCVRERERERVCVKWGREMEQVNINNKGIG